MIYAKTVLGREEITVRGMGLSPVQRRLLIMIDGEKTSSQLRAFVRTDELEGALSYLQGQGLIEPMNSVDEPEETVATAAVVSRASHASPIGRSPPDFIKVRQATGQFVSDRLGTPGEPICAAIERCANPDQLRQLLRGVEIFIGQRLDEEATQAFVRHFRGLLL